jgi:glycosyltransferase involved in cell wall biosynthesis
MTTARPDSSSGLWIDDRYRGEHGIGRYAREVISRLSVPWRSLGLDGAPSNPIDSLRRLPPGSRHGLIYSPGYGALLGAGKQILTVHDLIHLKVNWPGRAKYLAYYNGAVRRTIRRAGVVLTVSETSRRDIQEWIHDDDVEVVNAGIGCSEAFVPEGPSAVAVEPYVFYVGNLRAHKNLDTVLRALVRLRGVHLRAVLPEREIPHLRARCVALGIEDQVVALHGMDDDELAAQYRGAACTVFPSVSEGFGLPALESIMCGTRVIYWEGCTTVAETAEGSGQSVSSSHDADEWAEKIRAEITAPTRSRPTAGRYDWARTAGIVEASLRAGLTPG